MLCSEYRACVVLSLSFQFFSRFLHSECRRSPEAKNHNAIFRSVCLGGLGKKKTLRHHNNAVNRKKSIRTFVRYTWLFSPFCTSHCVCYSSRTKRVKRHEKYKGVSSLTNSGEEETERLKKMRVYCKIYGVYEGFRVLEMFDPMVGKVWSSTGEFFPMYDPETNEIFECGFNSAFSTVVAYAEIDIKDFREKLKECAQEVIEKRVREAIEKASNEVAPLWMLAEFF